MNDIITVDNTVDNSVDNTADKPVKNTADNNPDNNAKNQGMLPKLDLNITNRCNYRCVHCAFDSGIINLSELSLDKIMEILSDTRALGGERIDITGGEPLARKDVSEIIKIGKCLDFKIEVVTNGSLLSEERIEEFKKLGLDSIAISLDGPDYETYSRIRLVDQATYQKVLSAIDDVLRAGIRLKINTVAFQSNYRRIPEMTQWCISKGIYEHGIYYYTAIGRGVRNDELSIHPAEWLDFVREELTKYQDRIKVSVEFPFIEKNRLIGKDTRCLAESERYHLQILPDGNVYPCAIMASYGLPIANLHEKRMQDIWNNTKLWEDYWKRAQERFCDGACVDFKRSFDCKSADLIPICPLKKYMPREIG